MTKQSERLWALSEDKRAQLLDPAEAEFSAKGFEDASLNRILTEARMSKGQAYYYITGKSDLYLAVCTRSFTPFLVYAREQTNTLTQTKDYWRAVEDLAGDLAQRLAASETLSALASGIYDSAAAQECLRPLAVQVDDIMERIVHAGQIANHVRSDLPETLMRDMLKGMTRSIDRWFARNGPSLSPAELEQTSRGTFEMIRNSVKPPKGADNA